MYKKRKPIPISTNPPIPVPIQNTQGVIPGNNAEHEEYVSSSPEDQIVFMQQNDYNQVEDNNP